MQATWTHNKAAAAACALQLDTGCMHVADCAAGVHAKQGCLLRSGLA